jgi:hypothetical protein
MKDLIIANIATIPQRTACLEKAISTIIDQVDLLNISLDSYNSIPSSLQGHPKIYCSLDTKHRYAERGKFFWVNQVAGYYFTVDDDILYPTDYVTKMIEAIERYDRKAIITVHGNNIKHPFINYYKSMEPVLFRSELRQDTSVDFPGTGTMAFHTDTMKFSIKDFELPYMSDLWLGLLAKQNKVPVIAIQRDRGWLTPMFVPGIYEQGLKDPLLRKQQVDLIRRFIAA